VHHETPRSIVEDLHKLREKIGKAHAFDVRRIAATIRQHEEEGAKTIVREAPRRSLATRRHRSNSCPTALEPSVQAIERAAAQRER